MTKRQIPENSMRSHRASHVTPRRSSIESLPMRKDVPVLMIWQSWSTVVLPWQAMRSESVSSVFVKGNRSEHKQKMKKSRAMLKWSGLLMPERMVVW
jgi:hypothetical protein